MFTKHVLQCITSFDLSNKGKLKGELIVALIVRSLETKGVELHHMPRMRTGKLVKSGIHLLEKSSVNHAFIALKKCE